MNARRVPDAAGFQSLIQGFLLKAEAENNLFLGVLGSLVRSNAPTRDESGEPWYLVAEASDGSIQGAAMITPPSRIILTSMPEAASRALARLSAHEGAPLVGSIGPVLSTRQFAQELESSTGKKSSLRHRQGIYAITRVLAPIHAAPGALRVAETSDLGLIALWAGEFIRETGIDPSDPQKVAARFIQYRQLFIWEHKGIARSMAAWSGPTPNGVRINLVYTPPEERMRGWASQSVAALTQKLFDEGNQSCFLFTDLSNPTSNHIYQQMGYRAVTEVQILDFL